MIKLCLISSIPVTLWSFYRKLPEKLKLEGIEIEICSSPGKELKYFENEYNVPTHEVKITRQITPLQDIISILKLAKLFRYQRYDIVHAHTPKAGLLGMIAATMVQVKCRIYTCHGLPMETESGIKRWILKLAEKTSCFLAHKVLAVSKSLAEKLKVLGLCKPSKIQILGEGSACGVDLSRFNKTDELIEKGRAIRNEHSISKDDMVIGFIGRLVPDKGIGILVDSFARLYQSNQNFRLLVIGNFEAHRGILSDKTVEILNNHPGLILCAFTDQIEPYYAAMDMLVLPSRREGFPYTILEASAMGLPVIATKVTGCIDSVLDGRTGILVEPDNAEQLYQALLQLGKNPQLRKRLGEQGRQRVETLFDSRLLIDKHISLYKELIDRKTFRYTDK